LKKRQSIIVNKSQNKSKLALFFPKSEKYKGLHTQGYFKRSKADKPLITVVTVVFEGDEFLEETIQSVVNQTYDSIEYILIDGGSTDGTVDIIKRYENEIAYWVSEPDGGIYDAMNKGVNLSSGEWICFMNAGDVFYDNQTIKSIFSEINFANIDLFYGNHFNFNKSLNNKKEVNNTEFSLTKSLFNGLKHSHQSTFVKSDFCKKNLFDLEFNLASDFNQFLIAYFKGKTVYIDLPISIVDINGISNNERVLVIKEYRKILYAHNAKFYYKFISLLSIFYNQFKVSIKKTFGL